MQARLPAEAEAEAEAGQYLIRRKQREVVLEVLEVGQEGVGTQSINVGTRDTFDQLPGTGKQDQEPEKKGAVRQERRRERGPSWPDTGSRGTAQPAPLGNPAPKRWPPASRAVLPQELGRPPAGPGQKLVQEQGLWETSSVGAAPREDLAVRPAL